MRKSIKFYMVPSSPWTYLSIEKLKVLSVKYKTDIDIFPIDIFKIFKKFDIKTISARPLPIRLNRLNELKRWKKHLKIKLNIEPKYFPVNPDKANKIIIACKLLEKKHLSLKLAEHLCKAVWVDNLNIDDVDTLFMILRRIGANKKIEKLFLQGKVNNVLQENTKMAEKDCVFGVPSFVYKKKLFWGQDRLFFLEKELI